jgi:hypothetical protein
MTLVWRVVGGAAGFVAMLCIVALSDRPAAVEANDDGLLRLSWRTVSERIQHCRAPNEQDLAGLPRHMRPKEICEGKLAAFELVVTIDGELIVKREIRPAGVREDRPIYVYEERPLRPGSYQLDVTFSRLDDDGETALPLLQLRSRTRVPARGVVLVTSGEADGGLVLKREVGES